MFSGYEHKHTGISRNRRTYRTPYKIPEKNSCCQTAQIHLYLNSLLELQGHVNCRFPPFYYLLVDNKRKYQLSAYSKNVYVGRILLKTSNS